MRGVVGKTVPGPSFFFAGGGASCHSSASSGCGPWPPLPLGLRAGVGVAGAVIEVPGCPVKRLGGDPLVLGGQGLQLPGILTRG